MMSIDRSGVRTWTAACVSSQNLATSVSVTPMVGVAPASDEIDSGGRTVGLAEEYDDLGARSIGQLDGRLEGCTRIQPGAGRSLEGGTAGERSGALWTTVASEELRAVGRPAGLPTAEIEEGDPAGEVGVPRVPGEQRLRFRLVLGDDVRCVGAHASCRAPTRRRR